MRADRPGRAARDRGQPVLLGRAARAPGTCSSRCRGPAPPASGAIVLADALVALDCRLERLVAGRRPRARAARGRRRAGAATPTRCRCSASAAATSTRRARVRPAVTGPREKVAGQLSHPGPGGAQQMWTSYGHRCRSGAAAVLRGAARPRTEQGAGMPRGRPGRPRGRLPRRVRAGRLRRRPRARVTRPGRGRRPGGLPLLRPLLGARRRGRRLADRRRHAHRAQPAPLRPPPRAREETADDGPAVVPDVADLVVTREERSPVRAALGPAAPQAGGRAGAPAQRPQLRRGRRRPRPVPRERGHHRAPRRIRPAQGVEPPCVIPTEGVLRRLVDEPAGVTDDDRAHVASCPTCLRGARRPPAPTPRSSAPRSRTSAPTSTRDAAWARLSTAHRAAAPPPRSGRSASPAAAGGGRRCAARRSPPSAPSSW